MRTLPNISYAPKPIKYLNQFLDISPTTRFFICSIASAKSRSVAAAADYSATPIQLQAIVHYATFTITPQQNIHEISISFNVLKELAPANFLVFCMGRVEKFRRRRRGNKREKKRKKKKKSCVFFC
ncbi:hypothetical protein IGI04_040299 [Brassica rapa subsp. trilocularis]|uniref:Uncharacterized protein n=1 Tax=Brassica rapa subsp. trilocularis TaxID=1813537 RepID=A0ABQ7KRM8_BRACM|nr:hypothetical protein IGI04_040299 [Brassica rapa subsp. trilocularis]